MATDHIERQAWRRKAVDQASRLTLRGNSPYPHHTLLKAAIDDIKDALALAEEGNSEAEDLHLGDCISYAENTLKIALQQFPNEAMLLAEEGELSKALAQSSRSERAFEKAFASNPRSTLSARKLSRIKRAKGAFDEAEKVLHKALEYNPGAQDLHYAFALAIIESAPDADTFRLILSRRQHFAQVDDVVVSEFAVVEAFVDVLRQMETALRRRRNSEPRTPAFDLPSPVSRAPCRRRAKRRTKPRRQCACRAHFRARLANKICSGIDDANAQDTRPARRFSIGFPSAGALNRREMSAEVRLVSRSARADIAHSRGQGDDMTDAILFSAKPSMVDVDDARRHLEDHKELYWSVGFPIAKDQFLFPIFGFIHISGGQVEYRALVDDIVPFSAKHYENPSLKPEPWRERWKSDPNERNWKNCLVMTEIVPFSFDTYQFEKSGGGLIAHPPQSYVRVIPPNQPSESAPAQPSRISIAEKNLEDLVVQQLDEIEPGLSLVSRQLSTPAGRLDLFCRDVHGNYVVVELKKTQGTDQVVGQILRYMGWVREISRKQRSRYHHRWEEG